LRKPFLSSSSLTQLHGQRHPTVGFDPSVVHQLVLHFKRTLSKDHCSKKTFAFCSVHPVRSLWQVVIAPVAPVAALFGNGSVKICALVLFTNILISLPCSAPAKSATAQICRSCHPVQLLCLTLENAVELPNLAALSTVALLVDFILLQLSSRPEHSFNLSGHFDRCTFSHVDLQCQPSSELTLSCACGVAQSRCADPLC